MSRDTYKVFHLIRKVKQLLTDTGMVGKSYFNHRKRKVSKISAGGRLRRNNQALSYLSITINIVFVFCLCRFVYTLKNSQTNPKQGSSLERSEN